MMRATKGIFTPAIFHAALANIFFISLVSLLSRLNIGYVALLGVLFGFRSIWRLFLELPKTNRDAFQYTRNIFWLATSSLIYLIQALFAIRIVMDPTAVSNIDALMGILVGLFVIGLRRSWELIGIRV